MPRGVSLYDEARLQGRLWPFQAIQPRLIAWYDAGDLSTIVYSGGVFSQWLDKSGNGRHLASNLAGGGRPIYSPSVFRGRPGVSNVYSGWMGNTAINLPTGTIINVFLLATDYDTGPGGCRLVSLAQATGYDYQAPSFNPLAMSTNYTSQVGTYVNNTTPSSVTIPLVSGSKTGPFIISSTWGVGTQTMALNGVANAPTSTSYPSTSTITKLAIGNSADGGGLGYGIFTTGQCLLVSGLMTPALRLQIESAMVWSHLRSNGPLISGPFVNRPPLIGD